MAERIVIQSTLIRAGWTPPGTDSLLYGFRVEDGGMAMILDFAPFSDVGFKLRSWDETKAHTLMRSLEGKRVTVTLTVEEGEEA